MDYQAILTKLHEIENNRDIESSERIYQINELIHRCNQLYIAANSLDDLIKDATILEKITQLLVKVVDQST